MTPETTMKALIAVLPVLLLARAFAADAPTQSAALQPNDNAHRYLVERTFPPGALAGLDAATKEKVNANNASVGVRWLHSYANADKTRTFCVYEGPSEAAIRKAATLNALPVDSVTEVPVDLDPGTQAHSEEAAGENHRYLVERTFAPGALDGLDAAGKAKVNTTNARFGVHWVTSYANADKTKTYCIYEGPSAAAVRKAASANAIPVDAVTEVPVTLLPK
jgi:predicted dinucleotide-utilizing enzyme